MKALLYVVPELARALARRGQRDFDDVFNLCGKEVVSGHRARNVSVFELGRWSGFIKREFYVPWKDYVVNWWAGFGWVSKSAREWQTLHGVRIMGIDAPEPLGYGEKAGRAFLLVKTLSGYVPLVEHLAEVSQNGPRARRALARRLGVAVAKLHEAGFNHPDLYAKHVYVHADEQRIAFLDFQRTRRFRSVPWASRWRDLAALNASLSDECVSPRERLTCLAGYLAASQAPHPHVVWRTALRAIERRTQRLLRRRKVQAMRRQGTGAAAETRIDYCRVAVEPGGRVVPAAGGSSGRLTDQEARP